jgi:hypothetical protein
VASTRLGADEAPMGCYPVDEIKGKTHCELHQSMKNISMKVAVSYALSCEPGVTWHSRQIPDGYAHVGVDEIVPRYESLELHCCSIVVLRIDCRRSVGKAKRRGER